MWIHASRRYPLLALGALALALLGVAGATAAAQAADPAPLTLRLPDLPKGWRVGDDTGCGPMGLENAPPAVVDLVKRHHPSVCVREFNRVWATAPPFFVESVAITFDGPAGATDALAAAEPVVRYVTQLDGAAFTPTSPVIGDSSTGFAVARAYLPGPQPSPASVVVWRSGDVLAIVDAGATSVGAADAAALRYAQEQQARIETPTPVSASDFDDVLVSIDNPKLGVPVWWLGRDFDPPGPLPAQTLQYTGGPFARGASPGNTADLRYYSPMSRGPGGIYLQIWKRPAWKRFLGTRLGRLIDSPCARQKTLRVRGGTAVIQRYWATPQSRPCPKQAPNRFVGILFAGKAVVTVNAPLTWTGVRIERPGTYSSLRGLETVLRALRRR